jgi:hypothetical protein
MPVTECQVPVLDGAAQSLEEPLKVYVMLNVIRIGEQTKPTAHRNEKYAQRIWPGRDA